MCVVTSLRHRMTAAGSDYGVDSTTDNDGQSTS